MRMRLLLNASRAATLTALLLATAPPARADGALPAAATPVQREQAQARFLRAKDLMEKKQYVDALGELRASHDIVASPNTRLQIARCLVAMEKTIEAYAEFGRTAIEAKELTAQDRRYQRAYDAALAERAEIEPRLGFVTLAIENPGDDTKVTVAGEEIRRAAWSEPTPVGPGVTEITTLTPGHDPIQRTVTLAAGEKTSLAIDAQSGARTAVEAPPAPPPPAPPPPEAHGASWMRTGAYVAGGVGVAGLATLAVFGLMARSTYDDLNAACMGGPCPASKADEISSGKTDRTIANVGLVLGLVGVGVGGTLLVLSLHKGARGANGSSAGGAPALAIAAAPGWIGVRGSL
jgi:hypothetical protein